MTRMAKTVREWMTRIPVEVDRREPLSLASDLVRRHGIRHLPVLDGYHLYGIVSDRDLTRAQSRKRPASGGLCLGDICERDVLAVAPTTSVGEVARQMVDRAVDSAVVRDGEFVVGIFTTTDALRTLGQLSS